jgi:hypothetical protein
MKKFCLAVIFKDTIYAIMKKEKAFRTDKKKYARKP